MSASHGPFRLIRLLVAVLAGVLLVGAAVLAGAKETWSPPTAYDDPGVFATGQYFAGPGAFEATRLGYAVDMDGDTAVAGCNTLGDPPRVLVYGRSGSSWSREATLAASDAPNDYNGFGEAVAVSGNTTVVGAYLRGSRATGAAYVFERSGSTWTETAILPGSSQMQAAGSSVDVAGDTILVGAPYTDAYQGLVHVYQRTGGSWSHVATLTAPTRTSGDRFGSAVKLSGDTAFVGEWGESGSRGAVHVYSRSGGVWSGVATLTIPGSATSARFGHSIAADADRVLIGAPGTNGTVGAAYVFVRTGDVWSVAATLTPNFDTPTTYFGMSAALSGNRALVGAPWLGSSRGEVAVFDGPTWSRVATLTSPSPGTSRYFGNGIALSGDHAMVGEPFYVADPGGVYFLQTPVYGTTENVPLAIPSAKGVLSNDRGNASLVTTQATTPGHGTVALASDGGFVYTPERGFAGVDTFTYKAYDGYGVSSPAVVSITVTPGKMQVPVSPYAVRRGRVIQVYGVAPHRHSPGSFPVVLDCYRLEGGEWVWRKSVKMKAYAYPRRTKYGRWLTLPLKGRWRLIARDTEGDVTRYSAPRYMRVW
jgi:hypothetical protein